MRDNRQRDGFVEPFKNILHKEIILLCTNCPTDLRKIMYRKTIILVAPSAGRGWPPSVMAIFTPQAET